MAACPQCSGFKKIAGRGPGGRGIVYSDCPCTKSETPGRIASPYPVNYPPEVISALQQAGTAQRAALQIKGVEMKRFLSYAAVLLLLFTASVSAATVQLASSSTSAPSADDGWRSCVVDALYEHRRFASCRVQVLRPHVHSDGTTCMKNLGYGSGTVVNKRTLTNGKTIGLVITCAHLFPAGWTAEQVRELSPKTQFPLATETNSALVLAIDWNNDISVWAIYVKKDQPVIPLADKYTETVYNVCGFGPDAKFRSRRGKMMGYVSVGWDGGDGKVIPAEANQLYVTSGQNQLYVQSGDVYVGDSGGGIITQDNKLAAVLWGGSNPNAFGTYSGTIKQFLRRRLPSSFQWGNNPCPTGTSAAAGCSVPSGVAGRLVAPAPPGITQPRRTPNYPTPDLDPLPVAPAIPDIPVPMTSPSKDHETTISALAKIQQGIDTLMARTDTSGTALLPIIQGQGHTLDALVQIRAELSELANKEQAVTITVQSPKFISPSYVDVSVLWALQQGSGIDHVVLIVDTSSDQWQQQLSSEYELALEQFPALVLFDIVSYGIQFKELPQLVVYPVNPGKQPVIVKGVDLVVKKLQTLVRDDPGGFLGAE